MTSMPVWALSFSYLIHMVSTVIWLGGLVTVALFILPFIQKNLRMDDREKILNIIQKKLNPLGWMCLFILIGTGMFQMSEHPSYQGFLSIDNDWAIAIFIKHIFIILMVIAMGYMTWFVIPGLKKIALKQKIGREINVDEILALRKKEKLIIWTNFVLAIFVLIFTAWARSVS
ncbi:MAG TPA: hypothetical protein VK856_03615 [Anaerolineaceae bacterium]|nr:hypothetical protein [Anaerolineaceae bacterium]